MAVQVAVMGLPPSKPMNPSALSKMKRTMMMLYAARLRTKRM